MHRASESAKVRLRQRLTAEERSLPVPTECSADVFEFARVESRAVVASFDGGRITSDAGALLLGATDRVIGLTVSGVPGPLGGQSGGGGAQCQGISSSMRFCGQSFTSR